MLGRYTPAGLECANMTRMHAMRTASDVLETEHLAMALLMASPTLFDWLSAEDVEKVRRVVDSRTGDPNGCGISMVSGAGALPPGPSDGLKRVIDRSADDARRLQHRRIAPEHLLAGLLAETDAPAVSALVKLGVTRERVLDDLAAGRVKIRGVDPPTRESLKQRMEAWIDRLPADDLNPVEMMVDAAERHEGKPRTHHMPEPEPGRPLSEEAPWSVHLPPAMAALRNQRVVSQRSSTSTQDGAHVFTSRRTVHGYEITSVERFRVSEDGRTIACSQEISGPGHTSERRIEFEIPLRNHESGA